jgi:hypothetical protein
MKYIYQHLFAVDIGIFIAVTSSSNFNAFNIYFIVSFCSLYSSFQFFLKYLLNLLLMLSINEDFPKKKKLGGAGGRQ